MKQFAFGFGAASVFWVGVIYAHHAGVQMPGHTPAAEEAEVAEPTSEGSARGVRRPPSGERRRARLAGEARPTGEPGGEGSVGDELDDSSARELDLGGTGGEEQLPASAIESAFDAGMPAIRRCLVLVDSDEPTLGTLRFQLRISPEGGVAGARLRGPSAVTSGEAGECLVSAARALPFPAFDGPEMDVSYPLHLE